VTLRSNDTNDEERTEDEEQSHDSFIDDEDAENINEEGDAEDNNIDALQDQPGISATLNETNAVTNSPFANPNLDIIANLLDWDQYMPQQEEGGTANKEAGKKERPDHICGERW
jgi:hypothetical protein